MIPANVSNLCINDYYIVDCTEYNQNIHLSTIILDIILSCFGFVLGSTIIYFIIKECAIKWRDSKDKRESVSTSCTEYSDIV